MSRRSWLAAVGSRDAGPRRRRRRDRDPLPSAVFAPRTHFPTTVTATSPESLSPSAGPVHRPTLAAILGSQPPTGQPAQGAMLLGIYSLGSGIPFLLAGLAFTRVHAVVRILLRPWRAVSVASG